MDKKQTAMQQLLNQLREERNTLPMDIEWNRCFQAIESVIETKFLPLEKEQIIDAYRDGRSDQHSKVPRFYSRNAIYYYNETYGE